MERFYDFGLKINNQTCLNEYMNCVSRRGQGHSLNFDQGLYSYFDNFKHLLKRHLANCNQISASSTCVLPKLYK